MFVTDIDNNGFLDQKDFECMGKKDNFIKEMRMKKKHDKKYFTALRATIVEGKGDCSQQRLDEYQKMMRTLWEDLSAIADFDKVSILTLISFVFVKENKKV